MTCGIMNQRQKINQKDLAIFLLYKHGDINHCYLDR